jgi:hypothetical protein
MYASDDNVLFRATIQLSAPTITSPASTATDLRSYSPIEDFSSPRKTRYRLTALSISFSKHSHLNKQKIVRDIPTETITHRGQHHLPHFDNNNKQAMTTALAPISKNYLSAIQYYQYPISSSCSSTKHNKSIKNTLLGIWQGSNTDELRSTASLPIDPKYIEERVKKVKSNILLRLTLIKYVFVLLYSECSKLESFFKSCYIIT